MKTKPNKNDLSELVQILEKPNNDEESLNEEYEWKTEDYTWDTTDFFISCYTCPLQDCCNSHNFGVGCYSSEI